jgi:hypothetical protein
LMTGLATMCIWVRLVGDLGRCAQGPPERGGST